MGVQNSLTIDKLLKRIRGGFEQVKEGDHAFLFNYVNAASEAGQ